LNDLQQLIGDKDESELRELFDFPNMLKFNILLTKQRLAPKKTSPAEALETAKYFADGQQMVDIRFGRLIRPSRGELKIIENPGQIVTIGLSRKYLDSKAQLFKFESSAQIPSGVRNSVSALDQAVQNDVTLIFDVLNKNLKENTDEVFEDQDHGSPYFSVTTNDYWGKLTQLRPKAQAVTDSIRSYLKVK